MHMKNISLGLFILTIITIASCGAISSKGTNITGTISDAMNMKVYFDRLGPNNTTTLLGESTSDGDGKFTIKLEEPITPAIYRIRIGSGKTFLIIEDPMPNISVRGTLEGMKTADITVMGSESASEFMQAMHLLSTGKINVDDINDYINNTPYPLCAMQMAINAFGNQPQFYAIHKKSAAALLAKYPDHEYTAGYVEFAANLEKAASQPSNNSSGPIQVGMPAPEIQLSGPDGKIYTLSDLKGKVVLLDFWASWCGPCRKANPHVVETYNKYKDKGFTVFSVSLDGIDERTKARYPSTEQYEEGISQSKKRWIEAIEKDQLAWPYHVSELSKWDTQAAKKYGVSSIPRTFLIDRDGNIAAVNPRTNLEEALLKVL